MARGNPHPRGMARFATAAAVASRVVSLSHRRGAAPTIASARRDGRHLVSRGAGLRPQDGRPGRPFEDLRARLASPDGFDLGISIRHPFVPKDETERQIASNAIGPLRGGNEAGMVTLGGAPIAMLPAARVGVRGETAWPVT